MPSATTTPTVRSQSHPPHTSLRPDHRPRRLRRLDHHGAAPAAPALRVLLASPQPVLRAGLRELLARTAGLEPAGEAAAAGPLPALAGATAPDVVLVDLEEPGGAALTAIRAVVSAGGPRPPVLALGTRRDEDAVVAALRAGASGYALKDVGEAELVAQIRLVAGGGAGFSPGVAGRLLTLLMTANPRPRELDELTEREYEVLELLAAGAANKQIAHRLSLSPKTVRNYVSSLCTKLGVVDRTQAALRAREAGLVRP